MPTPATASISLAIAVVVMLMLDAVFAAAPQCLPLKQTVYRFADYNSSLLGYKWWAVRRDMSKRYGCRPPSETNSLFKFELGCGCGTHEVCGGSNFEYEYIGQTYVSPMGECKCCAAWVIAMMVIFPLAGIILFLQRKRLKRAIYDCYYGKDKHSLKNSQTEREMDSIIGANPNKLEEGRVRSFHGGKDKAKGTKLKRRAQQYAVANNTPRGSTATGTGSTSGMTPRPGTGGGREVSEDRSSQSFDDGIRQQRGPRTPGTPQSQFDLEFGEIHTSIPIADPLPPPAFAGEQEGERPHRAAPPPPTAHDV